MTEAQNLPSSSLRLVRIISVILSPPAIAFGTVIVFAFFSPIGTGLLQQWQTFDVRNRRDRPLLYLAAIFVYSAGAVVAWIYQNHAMAILAVAYAAVTSVIALVSIFWKVESFRTYSRCCWTNYRFNLDLWAHRRSISFTRCPCCLGTLAPRTSYSFAIS
ncbi:MAG: hypothetical protein ACXACF_07915 [Candidatus Hermodarchaeia archaeon]